MVALMKNGKSINLSLKKDQGDGSDGEKGVAFVFV
jgi:hypothetical protein